MPQVAQFQLPTPGQQPQQTQGQLPAGAPAVVQFPLPPSAQSSGPDSSTISSEFNQSLPLGTKILQGQQVTPQQGADTASGILKGVGQIAQSADVLDTMNKMAGQPTLSQRMGVSDNALQPSNPTQQAASFGTQGLALATPVPEISASVDAAKAAKIPGIAEDIAGVPNTVKNVTKGLMSLKPSAQASTDAKAIEPLVQQGILKAGNSAKVTLKNAEALKTEIGNSAQALESTLKAMEIKPTIQPEELTNIFKGQLASIDKNVPPSGQTAAKQTAQWIWQKFVNNLPKDRDILPEDLLGARKATDAEIESIKGSNVFDPATENGFTTALRSYRQGANNLLETKAPGSKAALKYQSSLYNVLENVAKKGAGAVKEAEQIANTPGIRGLIARHPIATEIAKYGLGIGTASAVTGAAVLHAIGSQ